MSDDGTSGQKLPVGVTSTASSISPCRPSHSVKILHQRASAAAHRRLLGRAVTSTIWTLTTLALLIITMLSPISHARHLVATNGAQQAVRLLAFGDSLTVGWTSFQSGPGESYTSSLGHELKREHNLHVEITAAGQAGLGAAQAIAPLRHELGGSGRNPTHVLLLLGANDLLSHFQSGRPLSTEAIDRLISHLRELHAAVRSSGATSIALGLLHHPMIIQRAGALNSLREVNKRIETEVGADAFIDAGGLLPSDKPALWSTEDGGVHPSLSGYRTLGKHLAAPLARILVGQ